jgi:hypothetical protein
VHADAIGVAAIRALLLQVAEELVFVRAPFAVVAAEDDDVIDPPVPEELRVLRGVRLAVPADALSEELGIDIRLALPRLGHCKLLEPLGAGHEHPLTAATLVTGTCHSTPQGGSHVELHDDRP